MCHQLPTAVTVPIAPQVLRVLHRVRIPSYAYNIAIGPSYDSRLSEDADVVLFDLKQVERKLSLRHILQECRLRARGAVRFYMRALRIDNLIQRVDVGCEQGINATLLNCCHGVFCGLRHGTPLCTAIDRLLVVQSSTM